MVVVIVVNIIIIVILNWNYLLMGVIVVVVIWLLGLVVVVRWVIDEAKSHGGDYSALRGFKKEREMGLLLVICKGGSTIIVKNVRKSECESKEKNSKGTIAVAHDNGKMEFDWSVDEGNNDLTIGRCSAFNAAPAEIKK